MNTAFDLILLSAEQDTPGELENLTQLFQSGLTTFHLRKPDWKIEQTEDFLAAIPKEFLSKIVLHSHFELANKFAIKGIHLNEANKKLAPQLNAETIISASFHSIGHIKENTFPYRYIFLSPIFESISKPGYHSKFDLKTLVEELKQLRLEKTNLPGIIALGGITSGNIGSVKETGFDGAALLGSIWQSANPVKAFKDIQSIIGV